MGSRLHPTFVVTTLSLAALSLQVAAAQDVAGPPPGAGASRAVDAPKVVEGVSTFKLTGHRDWTSSGLSVRKGDVVRIRAWGRVRIAGAGGQLVDPAGLEARKLPRLLDTAPACQIICVVGDDNNDYISVGKEAEFRAAHDGTLYLTLNQVDPTGNSGDFDVRVAIGNARGLSFGHVEDAPILVPAPVPTQPAGGGDDKVVAVQPRLDWTNTYVTVRVGDTVVVEASGAVVLDLAGHATGPDGIKLNDPKRLIPDKPTGALIAVVGVDNNDFVFLGAKGRFVSQRNGLLFLGVNEDDLSNNSGSFSARVHIERSGSAAP